MTTLSLQQIVGRALAEIGLAPSIWRMPKGKPRTTTWLGVENGFGIRHYATGRNVYIVQTRMGGRVRTVTLGPASVLTRHQAQMVARRVLAYARVGHDPASERKRIRSAPRFDEFLLEYWTKCSVAWKPSTVETQSQYRRAYIDGAFPDLFIDEINEGHVAKWFASLTDRAGPGAANRCLEILSAAFNKAEQWGYRLENTNPCRAVRANRRRQCERFLTTDELTRLGMVIAEVRAGDDQVRASAASVVALLVLTGCRLGEILGLTWGEVRGNRLKLADSKTGPRTVWLGDEARTVITAQPRYRNVSEVFWNAQTKKRIASVDHYWREMREAARLQGVRLHDLRHTFASHAAMKSETLPMIGRLLGHTKIASTARYAHFDDSHIVDAAELVGAAIKQMID
jgi:integrase